MKSGLIKVWNFLWEIFFLYCCIVCSGVAIAVGIVLPKFGILSLIIAIGLKLISMYSEYQERKRNEKMY